MMNKKRYQQPRVRILALHQQQLLLASYFNKFKSSPDINLKYGSMGSEKDVARGREFDLEDDFWESDL